MGQGLSCAAVLESGLFDAAAAGDLDEFEAALERDPAALRHVTIYDRLSPLHVAAVHGRTEVGLSEKLVLVMFVSFF